MLSKKSLLTFGFGLFIIFSSHLAIAQDSLYHIIGGRKNSNVQVQKPYVIMISIDGFRWDYPEMYGAKNLMEMGAEGIRAHSMFPSYPSKTFPNHYSLVTGLYPSHHGIVDNSFFDRNRQKSYQINNRKAVEDGSWYQGTPLWVLAERQSMITASFYWVGSEAAIQGIYPTYFYTYSDKIPLNTRLLQVKRWLELPDSIRPHLLTFYFPEVDHAGHTFGPDSPETRIAVQKIDSAIGQLKMLLDPLKLKINYIVVSDHGMAKVLNDDPILIDRKEMDLNGVKVFGGETQLNLYIKDSSRIKPLFDSLDMKKNHYKVYLKKDFPSSFHYNGLEDHMNRIGDIILLADFPYVFGVNGRKGSIGTHGFDPAIPEMQALFIANGPNFKKGLKISSFENIHVYPLVCKILGLNIESPIDGKTSVLEPILLNQSDFKRKKK